MRYLRGTFPAGDIEGSTNESEKYLIVREPDEGAALEVVYWTTVGIDVGSESQFAGIEPG